MQDLKNFTKDSSDEELIRNWTLSDDDKNMLSEYRKNNRQNMAIQICSMRLFGRMLDSYAILSPRIVNYINQQLELPPTLYVASEREKIYFDHRRRVLEYLNFTGFNRQAKIALKKWVAEQVEKYGVPIAEDLLPAAEQFLLRAKVVLPGNTRLKRFLGSVCFQYQQDIFKQIHAEITPRLKRSIDKLLIIPKSGCKSQFTVLKEYPPAATVTSLQVYLKRYQLLRDVGIQEVDFSNIEPKFLNHLFKLGKYYESTDIKRFMPIKRYSITAVFLFEISKIILDYLVDMHDQYISTIYRQTKNAYEEKHKQSNIKREQALDDITSIADIIFATNNNDPFIRAKFTQN